MLTVPALHVRRVKRNLTRWNLIFLEGLPRRTRAFCSHVRIRWCQVADSSYTRPEWKVLGTREQACRYQRALQQVKNVKNILVFKILMMPWSYQKCKLNCALSCVTSVTHSCDHASCTCFIPRNAFHVCTPVVQTTNKIQHPACAISAVSK